MLIRKYKSELIPLETSTGHSKIPIYGPVLTCINFEMRVLSICLRIRKGLHQRKNSHICLTSRPCLYELSKCRRRPFVDVYRRVFTSQNTSHIDPIFTTSRGDIGQLIPFSNKKMLSSSFRGKIAARRPREDPATHVYIAISWE